MSPPRPSHPAVQLAPPYDGGAGAGASVPVAILWPPGGGGRNMGRYVTTSDMSAMPTEKYPGVLALVLWYSLSPSQFWMLNTTAALYNVVFLSATGCYSLSL